MKKLLERKVAQQDAAEAAQKQRVQDAAAARWTGLKDMPLQTAATATVLGGLLNFAASVVNTQPGKMGAIQISAG